MFYVVAETKSVFTFITQNPFLCLEWNKFSTVTFIHPFFGQVRRVEFLIRQQTNYEVQLENYFLNHLNQNWKNLIFSVSKLFYGDVVEKRNYIFGRWYYYKRVTSKTVNYKEQNTKKTILFVCVLWVLKEVAVSTNDCDFSRCSLYEIQPVIDSHL